MNSNCDLFNMESSTDQDQDQDQDQTQSPEFPVQTVCFSCLVTELKVDLQSFQQLAGISICSCLQGGGG